VLSFRASTISDDNCSTLQIATKGIQIVPHHNLCKNLQVKIGYSQELVFCLFTPFLLVVF